MDECEPYDQQNTNGTQSDADSLDLVLGHDHMIVTIGNCVNPRLLDPFLKSAGERWAATERV